MCKLAIQYVKCNKDESERKKICNTSNYTLLLLKKSLFIF